MTHLPGGEAKIHQVYFPLLIKSLPQFVCIFYSISSVISHG